MYFQQAQIIRLLDQLAEKFDSSLLLITHDLGLAAEHCEKIAVMYAGNIVEFGPVQKVFNNPAHPYTIGLFRALPTPESDALFSIPGMVPDLIFPPPGCRFSTRCNRRKDECTNRFPPLLEIDKDQFVACFYPLIGEGLRVA